MFIINNLSYFYIKVTGLVTAHKKNNMREWTLYLGLQRESVSICNSMFYEN